MIDDAERRFALMLFSALGGSFVSLWQMDWKAMSWGERIFAMVVGIAFSIFGIPWIVADLMRVDITPLRVACGITFFGAAFGIPLLPVIKNRIADKASEWLAPKKGDQA